MTPRSPKSPARKKALPPAAGWGIRSPWGAAHWAAYTRESALAQYGGSRGKTWGRLYRAGWRVVRVEIREILPAPVPPRSRKSKGGSK